MNFKWKKLTPPQLRYYISVRLPSLYISRRVPVLTLRAVWREYNLNGHDAAMQEAKARGVLTVDEQQEALAIFQQQLINFPYCQKPGCKETTNLTVDHIKPRSKFPLLYAAPDNLKTLCLRHNVAKGKLGESYYDS